MSDAQRPAELLQAGARSGASQFNLEDQELSSRLWQDVADRDLDRGRILHLLYSCHDLHDDDEMMRCSDEAYVALVDPRDP